MKSDVIVLGAGMVGISAALHLLKRGRSVVLLDRRGPAEETSYGNAGLIQREGIVPYMFPRDLSLHPHLCAQQLDRRELSPVRASAYRAVDVPLLAGINPGRESRKRAGDAAAR